MKISKEEKVKGKISKFLGVSLLVAAACLMCGCTGSMPPLQYFSGQARAAGPGESELVVHRVSAYVGAAGGMRVVVNGRERLVLRNGQSGTIIVPNGRHTVYVESTIGKGMARSDILAVDAAGARIVFEGVYNMSMSGVKFVKYGAYPLGTTNVPVSQTRPAAAMSGGGAQSGGVNAAVRRAGSSLMNDLPNDSKIAVVDVTADNPLVLDELEFLLVSSRRFLMLYRGTSDDIRQDKAIKLAGDINDQALFEVGHLKGVGVVVASSTAGNTLTLRALDVKKGQVIAMARESY